MPSRRFKQRDAPADRERLRRFVDAAHQREDAYVSRTKGISEDDVVEAVSMLIVRHGYSPSFREVAAELDVNLSTVARWLTKLRSQGRIAYEDDSPRTLRIVG